MKNLSTQIVTGIVCFGLGVGLMAYQKSPSLSLRRAAAEEPLGLPNLPKLPKLKLPLAQKPSSDEAMDPFQQMQRQIVQMQRQMMQQFQSPAMLSLSGDTLDDINQREDDKYVYVEVPMKGSKQDQFKVRVSNGQIQISGTTQTQSQEDSSQSFMSSSFHRSFPVPPGVDEAKVQMENSKDKLILKFPKLT